MNIRAVNPIPQRATLKITPEAWDEIRIAFHRSILTDTPLASLAQNIEGCAWALPDPEEKPSAYIDLRYSEVLERLRSRGLSPARFDDLVEILKGTLEFDQSFGAMLPASTTSAAPDGKLGDGIQRNLVRLGIPADFPLSLCGFAPGTKNFCREQGMVTLSDFLVFARRASRAVIVGGEFRDVLNAVAHIDEVTLATFLPFRPKSTGLYLVEALALLVRPMDLEQRVMLARQGGTVPESIRPALDATTAYFAAELKQLRAQHEQGTPLSRLVVSLDDLSLESAVCALLPSVFYPAAHAKEQKAKGTVAAGVPDAADLAIDKTTAPKSWISSLWPWK
jgi:hypothetical protein